MARGAGGQHHPGVGVCRVGGPGLGWCVWREGGRGLVERGLPSGVYSGVVVVIVAFYLSSMKILRPGLGRPKAAEISVVVTPGAAKAANFPWLVGPCARATPVSPLPTPGGDIQVTSCLGGGGCNCRVNVWECVVVRVLCKMEGSARPRQGACATLSPTTPPGMLHSPLLTPPALHLACQSTTSAPACHTWRLRSG